MLSVAAKKTSRRNCEIKFLTWAIEKKKSVHKQRTLLAEVSKVFEEALNDSRKSLDSFLQIRCLEQSIVTYL